MQTGESVFQWLHELSDWLVAHGFSETAAIYLIDVLELGLLLLLAFIANTIVKRILLRIVAQFAQRTRTDWDDVLMARRFFRRLSHFAPAMIIWRLSPVVFQTQEIVELTRRGVEIYMLLIALLAVDSLLNAVNDIYQRFDVARRIPILGYLQVVKIIVTLAVVIVAVSIIIDKSPLLLLSGLGALTAVILLIFKDSILGLVAGIQLVANDMVRPGDWIAMPKYGADGDVIEITLNTVKVQNWDKTVTTIPTYALISDSFINWRGMTESGGLRIKRAVYIDVTSVQFCTPEMIEKFSRIQVLKEYMDRKQKELTEYNKKHTIDESVRVNGRRTTNVGTFRAYLVEYLKRHPQVHQDMTFLVRQLQPNEMGLPIEIYVFSNDQAWANYEGIQADIFDHIFASLPEFGLRPFQNPTGNDIRSLNDGPGKRASSETPAQ